MTTTTIAAGASGSYNLAQGQSLEVTGTGVAVLGPGPQVGQQIALRNTSIVGPFPRAQTVYLTATLTSLTYEDDRPIVGAGVTPSGAVVNQQTGVAASVSGGGIVVLSADRVITAADDATVFRATTALTITIPAGLSPKPSFVADPPASGNLTIAVSGGAQINGGTTSLTRSRASYPAGVAVSAHNETDQYGVS